MCIRDSYSTLYVGPDVTINTSYYYAAFITASTDNFSYGASIDFNGKTNGGLYLNGNSKATSGNIPSITIGSTAEIKATADGYLGLYAAGYGNYIVEDGAYIKGNGSGIAIKSGNLTINGGTVAAVGNNSTPTPGFNNGVNSSGAAIQIESNPGYAGRINIDILGGDISSANCFSIYEYYGGKDQTEATTAVEKIAVTNGTFAGPISVSEVLRCV